MENIQKKFPLEEIQREYLSLGSEMVCGTDSEGGKEVHAEQKQQSNDHDAASPQ